MQPKPETQTMPSSFDVSALMLDFLNPVIDDSHEVSA